MRPGVIEIREQQRWVHAQRAVNRVADARSSASIAGRLTGARHGLRVVSIGHNRPLINLAGSGSGAEPILRMNGSQRGSFVMWANSGWATISDRPGSPRSCHRSTHD
jgi:hypothetical protein